MLRSSSCARLAVAVTLLAGCGGSQPIGAPGAMPQSRAVAAPAGRSGSWMLPNADAKSGALIYATGGCNGTCVISYSNGALVGSLATGTADLSGACADAQGNVFIAVGSTVTEFAHGGTTPIKTLSLPGNEAFGCSVDPTSSNLAVVFESDNG